jgi:hypothetical protein
MAISAVFLLVLATVVLQACGSKPAGEVSFIRPKDGASVTSPFAVKMAATGVRVEPAGAGVNEGAGHHHIIIDADLPAAGRPVPSDDKHRHFGKGQTETNLDLPPGEHTLRLSFADGEHQPYDPAVSDTIKVTVVQQ